MLGDIISYSNAVESQFRVRMKINGRFLRKEAIMSISYTHFYGSAMRYASKKR